jgi:lipoyl(octanoyl) transferase
MGIGRGHALTASSAPDVTNQSTLNKGCALPDFCGRPAIAKEAGWHSAIATRYGGQVNNVRDDLTAGLLPPPGYFPVEWRVSEGPVNYERALAVMEARVNAIADDTAPELVWLIEHPPLYTAGTSARPEQLKSARFPVHPTGRGGQFTYHGPGQRIAYVMLDLRRRGPDVRRFVASLEAWIIRALAGFGVAGARREDRVGVWVPRPDKGPGHEDKIAAIGIRVKRWVTLHGISLNVDCDLSHYAGIVPCGVDEARFGVTSLADLGIPVSLPEVDLALRREFGPLFGETGVVAGDPALEHAFGPATAGA